VESTPYFFKNETISSENANENNWIQIKLEGTVSNRDAFGTEVKLTVGNESYYRWYQGACFYAQSIKPVHFGIGESNIIDEIQISWPSGIVETYTNIAANQHIKIIEKGVLTDTDELITNDPSFSLRATPNPFYSDVIFSVEVNDLLPVLLNIYNITGQLIHSEAEQKPPIGQLDFLWNGSNLPNGIYTYEIIIGKTKIMGKVVKQ
ncbi:MAG: ASPIC/UnbV domain-containing protein, partial [Saprospiraceae bacterium]|nr:ASPIC/UnbV domain-containing protein [Saprospiraceae bacterium]